MSLSQLTKLNRKILISGASGMLGNALLNVFASLGDSEIYYISHSKKILDQSAHLLTIDQLSNHYFFAFYHCAAEVNVNLCEIDFEHAKRANAEYSKDLFRKVSARHNFYISTDSVYKGDKGDYKESDQANPVNNYALSKLMGEFEVSKSTKNLYILRTNIFGANSKNKSSLFEWAKRELEGGKSINGFKNIYFNPLSVQHLSIILKTMLEIDIPHGVYNIGCDTYFSKYDFLVRIADFIGVKKDLVTPLDYKVTDGMAIRPINTTINCEKIKQYLVGIDLSIEHSFELLQK
jgi:dTDP-4-dehydrorhamnose reductase